MALPRLRTGVVYWALIPLLRRTSMDELPQLWNVLRGEMSLVGPRPILDNEVPKYADVFDLYKKVLPGTPVAAFDTSYKMSAILSRFTAAKKLIKRLHKLGGRRIIPAETFHVIAREGPLYTGELERAQQWASSILQKTTAEQGQN